jgi:hypothetical protein
VLSYVSVADKRVRVKTSLQKAKTPIRGLAFPGSDARLPKKYYTLGFIICQETKLKISKLF